MTVEVTKADLDRIYDQLGELNGQVSAVAIAQTQTATILSGLKDSIDQAGRDRALTCPSRPDLNKMLAFAYAVGGKEDPVGGAQIVVNRVNTLWGLGKWLGAVIMAAAIIPGAVWFFQWASRIIAGAIAGS